MTLFLVSYLFILCQGSNLDYSFNATGFNFSTWLQSNEGFQCTRDHTYMILCKYQWDTVVLDLDKCGLDNLRTDCAAGANPTLLVLIVIEGIAIGVLVLYIYKKPRIDAREKSLLQNWLSDMSKKMESWKIKKQEISKFIKMNLFCQLTYILSSCFL